MLTIEFDGIKDAPHFQQDKSRKKQSTNIKRDEIYKINIINHNTFNRCNRFLNNDNRYMKVTLKSLLKRNCQVANFRPTIANLKPTYSI